MAKECDEQPSSQYAKGQNIPYQRLLQQWDQLIVHDGLLWRHYAQPDEQQGWIQLVIPNIRTKQKLSSTVEVHSKHINSRLASCSVLHM